MIEFAQTFLLIFGQLALGGMIALSVPGFHQVERGFYKSTACVYLGCGLAIFLGKAYLVFTTMAHGGWTLPTLEVASWGAFCAGCGLYTYTLWGDRFVLRARSYVVSLLLGLVALGIGAATYRTAPLLSVETLMFPLCFLTSALMLGAAATGMSLGHWYLIEVDLPLDPFKRMFAYYAGTLIVHVGVLVTAGGLLFLVGWLPTTDGLQTLWNEHSVLLSLRIGLGPLASLCLAYMIWRTLQIPQTMAATGLFYLATLSALVGELAGRFVLYQTGLPL